MEKIFTKFKNKTRKFLNSCYSTKEGANGKKYGSNVIPKHGESEKICFASVRPTPKETKDTGVVLDEWFMKTLFSIFHLHPIYK